MGFKQAGIGRTISPVSSMRMSPGTTSTESISCTCPSRNTLAWGELILFNASKEDCARFSCTVPITALTTRMARITNVSIIPSPSIIPITPETMAAIRRMTTMLLLNWSKNIAAMICACERRAG